MRLLTFSPFFFALLFISSFLGCSNDPAGPCDEVNCLNGGSCDQGVCDCEMPYVGESCEIHYLDAVVGTYLGPNDDYYFSIEKINQSFIAIYNFDNTGQYFKAKFNNDNEFDIGTGAFADYSCSGDPIEYLGGKIRVIDDNQIEVEFLRYQKTCHGISINSLSGDKWRPYKESSEVCGRSYVDGVCDADLRSYILGTYSLSYARGIGTNTDHDIQVAAGSNARQVRISNLMLSNSQITVDISDYNHLEFEPNDLPLSMTTSTGVVVTTHSRLMRGHFTPDGKKLIFETSLYSGLNRGGYFVYERN